LLQKAPCWRRPSRHEQRDSDHQFDRAGATADGAPAHFTNKLKKQQLREYGNADRNPKHYEEDHLIALSIGGAPDNQRNLWPETQISEWNAKKKDRLEFMLYKMVCAQEISLVEAQHAMATNWIEAWKQYVPSHRHYRFKGRVD
jgi:hypothetical protein